MKKKLANYLKYNKYAYAVYHAIFSVCINTLKLFIDNDDKLIIFNSFAGRKFDDSPKEIFKLIKQDPRFTDYQLVWAMHDPDKYTIDGADVIKTDSLRYFIKILERK